MLELNHVSLALPHRPLIRDVSLCVAPGEVVAILGESGQGKSSLLNFIAGDLAPSFDVKGQIILDKTDITALPMHRRQIGMLQQHPLLFPHMTVFENLLFAVPQKYNRRERTELAHTALDRAELGNYAHALPDTLSGGQAARVALTRTLLAEPKALLLDEPFSKLDSRLRNTIREWVQDEVRRLNIPTLLVTHDMEDVNAFGANYLHLATTG